MKSTEFVRQFLRGKTFIHSIYGKVRANGLPDSAGLVSVYSYESLKEIIVDIKDLDSDDRAVRYQDGFENINKKTL